jgi:hypothetical protein
VNPTDLNVLFQTSSNTCCICEAQNNVTRLSVEAKVAIYVQSGIYVLINTRSCPHHLNGEGKIFGKVFVEFQDRISCLGLSSQGSWKPLGTTQQQQEEQRSMTRKTSLK